MPFVLATISLITIRISASDKLVRIPAKIRGLAAGSITRRILSRGEIPYTRVVSRSVGSTLVTPSIVFSRIGQRQTKAMMKIFIELPTPITRMANGSSAGGGIARKNSTMGAAARPRRQPQEQPGPDRHHHRDPVAGRHALEARHHVAAHPLEHPGVLEGGEDVSERREVVGLAAGRQDAPQDQHQDRHRHLEAPGQPALLPGGHAAVSPGRWDGCQWSTRRSASTKIVLRARPRIPVAMIRAYMSCSSPPERATLMERPSPEEPITSSAVTVRISDTAEAIRTPVAM